MNLKKIIAGTTESVFGFVFGLIVFTLICATPIVVIEAASAIIEAAGK